MRSFVDIKIFLRFPFVLQIGLVEQEWIDTLATLNADELTFMDFVDVAQKLSAQLKGEVCNFVISK